MIAAPPPETESSASSAATHDFLFKLLIIGDSGAILAFHNLIHYFPPNLPLLANGNALLCVSSAHLPEKLDQLLQHAESSAHSFHNDVDDISELQRSVAKRRNCMLRRSQRKRRHSSRELKLKSERLLNADDNGGVDIEEGKETYFLEQKDIVNTVDTAAAQKALRWTWIPWRTKAKYPKWSASSSCRP
ncbi:unnamed protein product [Bursaphelenchus xylophilus]|uniref:(pine wood nematode) hypothetical protein n=1 Tax=Bursaphelenchus xylophilus TaxID=6326 RepID=A0A811LYR2_BURXY|nr:unnamed protein product [Bursaphelenchus xylophilus]CAG9126956.1 unnamed protein product [Bursaphelenchus xylophilus]